MRRSLALKRQQRPKRLALWLGLAIIPTVSLVSILAILGALTALGGTIALAASSVLLEDLPDVRSVAAFEDSLFENSSVYAADGTKLGEIASEGRRTLLAADDIPQLV